MSVNELPRPQRGVTYEGLRIKMLLKAKDKAKSLNCLSEFRSTSNEWKVSISPRRQHKGVAKLGNLNRTIHVEKRETFIVPGVSLLMQKRSKQKLREALKHQKSSNEEKSLATVRSNESMSIRQHVYAQSPAKE